MESQARVTRPLKASLSGTNLELTGDYNQRLVYQAVRTKGPVTRNDLAELTGLAKPTIAGIVKRLLRSELISETGRIYGARGLKPINLTGAAVKTALDLTGIADPQSQGGGAAVSSVKASVAQLEGGNDVALTPAPAIGFSGSAALDGDGKFAGVALLKPVQVAGPANGASAAQALLVASDAVRSFLKANGVSATGGSPDAKASVVRVICVRK